MIYARLVSCIFMRESSACFDFVSQSNKAIGTIHISHDNPISLLYLCNYIYIYSFSLFVFIFLSFYLESFHKFIIFLNGNIFNLFDPPPKTTIVDSNLRTDLFCIFWRFFSCFCFCHLLVLSRMEKIILYRVKMVEIGLSKSGKSRAKFWNG